MIVLQPPDHQLFCILGIQAHKHIGPKCEYHSIQQLQLAIDIDRLQAVVPNAAPIPPVRTRMLEGTHSSLMPLCERALNRLTATNHIDFTPLLQYIGQELDIQSQNKAKSAQCNSNFF